MSTTENVRSGARRLPSPDELIRFRDASRRAARVLEQVAGELFAGISERGAARLLEGHLHAAGATGFLVEPRVLFGRRATLPRPGAWVDARPGWSTLEPTEIFLLEAVPLLGGMPAPVARVGGLAGRPEGLGAGEGLLAEARESIVRLVGAGATGRDVARALARLAGRRGWREATRPRPGWTLARRLERLPRALASPAAPWGAAALEHARLGAFALRRKAPAGRRPAPVWCDDPGADTPVAHGLWMVAPRFARGPVGVVARELLWVDPDGPRWLLDGPLPRG